MNSVNAVIFDMDGVLIDSEICYMRRLGQFVQESFQKRIPEEELLRIVGASGQVHWQTAAPYLPETWTFEDFRCAYRAYQEKKPIDYRAILFPGVLDALAAIRQLDLRMSIATSSPRHKVEQVLEECELRAYFDFYITGEDVKFSKPNPEIYLKSAAMHHVSTAKCLVVEDSNIGIRAAVEAGMCVIAKKESRYPVDQSHADFQFQSYVELPELIGSITKAGAM